MAMLMYDVYMKWSTAEARGNLSRLLRAAEDEPQVITNRGRPVAVVVNADDFEAYRRWRSEQAASSLAEALDQLQEACLSGDYALPLPSQADRPNAFVDVLDDIPG